jgi:hypothetical protein
VQDTTKGSHHGGVGKAATGHRVTATAEHLEVAVGSVRPSVQRLGDESALADARLADDDSQPRLTPVGVVDERRELLELRGAAHER